MRLRTITLEGFQSYREEEVVDLQGLNLAAVIGANHTGKSTLISNALDFALFGRSRGSNVGDVVSRGAPRVHVTVEFDLGDSTYKVTRSRTAKGRPEAYLYVSDPAAENGWRALSEKNSLNTDPAIIELLGMNAETAGMTWLIRQNEYGALCNLDPAPRRDALANAFGLSKYATLAKAADEKRRQSHLGAEKARYDVDSLTARVEALDVEGPFPDITDEAIPDEAKKDEAAVEAATLEMASLSDNTALREDLDKAQSALDEFLAAFARESDLYGRSRSHAEKVLFDATQAKKRAIANISVAETDVERATRALDVARARHREASEAGWETELLEEDYADASEQVSQAEASLQEATQALSAKVAEASALDAKIKGLASADETEREIAAAQSQQTYAEEMLARATRARADADAAAEKVPALEASVTEAEGRLTEAEKALRAARERTSLLGVQIGAAEASKASLGDREGELDEAVSALRDSVERGEGVCLSCRRPMTDAEAKAQIAEQEAATADLRRQIEEASGVIATLSASKTEATQEVTESDDAVAVARTEVSTAKAALHDQQAAAARRDAAAQAVTEAEQSLATSRERLAARKDKSERDERERTEAQAKIEGLSSERAVVQEQEQSARAAVTSAREAQATVRDTLNANKALAEGLAAATKAVTEAQAEVQRTQGVLEAAKAEPAKAEKDLADATEQVEATGVPPEIDEERQATLTSERDKAREVWSSASDVETARASIHARRVEHRDRSRRLWQEQERRARVAKDLAELQEPLEKATKKAEELESKVEAYGVLVDAFRPSGIPFMILSGIIQELNDEANEIMSTLGDDDLSVFVTTDSENQKGNSVDKVLIHAMTADGLVDYKTLSGSEQMRVALAIRLALTRCIARRSGNPLMTVVADECFAAFDPEGRQTLMNMFIRLSEPAGGGFSIFAIAHMADLTDAFPQVIEVTNTTGTSRARVLSR